MKAQAIQELIDNIKDHHTSGMVFNMAHLKALFDKRLASLGYPQSQCHTTRLRNDIISLNPDIKAIQKPSGSWDLVFDEDLSQALQEMKDPTSSDMRTLAQAVKILRRDMLDKRQMFSGSFTSTSEADSVVPFLRSFLHMLLDGPGIAVDTPPASSEKIVSSLAQTIMYNSVGKRSSNPQSVPRHPRERETPLSIMLAMKVHMQTGNYKESLVDTLAERGICVSYHRLRQLSTDIANSVITHWEHEGVVVPFQATKEVFTTGGVDIDYNPSSTTASSQSVLHGTGIS